MSGPSDINWVRLSSYLSGELPPPECMEVERWIAERDQHRVIVAQLRAAWGVIQPVQLAPLDVAELRRRVLRQHEANRISAAHQNSPEYSGHRPHRETQTLRIVRGRERVFFGWTLRSMVWSTAAAAVLGVALTVASWNMGVRHTDRRVATSMMTYTTGNGERATISLPDGGTVALNVASRLEVPMDYMAGHRTVRLVGEGLFTVSHHEGTPLTVMAGGTKARVLGTSFVVRRYATDTSAIVAVRDGKVAVGATVVTANQLVEVGRSGVPHVRPSDGSQFTFATGTLTIDGLLLPAAIVELNRWYDADIRLGDPALASRHVNAVFGAGSLSELAENLGSLYDVRVVRDGRVLTLNPRR